MKRRDAVNFRKQIGSIGEETQGYTTAVTSVKAFMVAGSTLETMLR